jgi:hypothetical protein
MKEPKRLTNVRVISTTLSDGRVLGEPVVAQTKPVETQTSLEEAFTKEFLRLKKEYTDKKLAIGAVQFIGGALLFVGCGIGFFVTKKENVKTKVSMGVMWVVGAGLFKRGQNNLATSSDVPDSVTKDLSDAHITAKLKAAGLSAFDPRKPRSHGRDEIA